MENLLSENDIIPTIVKSRTRRRVPKTSSPLADITRQVLNKSNIIHTPSEDYSKVKKPLKTPSMELDDENTSPIPIKSRLNRRKPPVNKPSSIQQEKRKASLPLISSSDDEDDFEEFKQSKRVIKQVNRSSKKVRFDPSSDSDFEEGGSSSQVVHFEISSDEDSVEILKDVPRKKVKEPEPFASDSSKEEQDEEEEEELDEEEESDSSVSSSEESDDDYQPRKKAAAKKKVVPKSSSAPKPRKKAEISFDEEDDFSNDESNDEEMEEVKPKATLTIKKKKTAPSELRPSENGWNFDVKNDQYVLQIADDKTGFAVSADVFEKLYSHQQIGVKWLAERHFANTLNGGILADDMGLGKTIQVSSFIHGLFLTQRACRVLVICPNSVVGNWQKELEKWGGDLIKGIVIFHQVGKASSTNRKRQGFVKEFEKYAKQGGAVMLSTFQTVANHVEYLSKSFKGDKLLDSIIIDEAHKIKNKDAKTSVALKTLGSVSKFGLTGTPICNKLAEMYSIYSWAFGEDLLGSSSEFSSNYSTPINQSTRRDANYTQKMNGNRAADNLRDLVNPYLLRRGKNEVLSVDKNLYKSSSSTSAKIGQKNDLIIWLKLTNEQQHWYKEYLSSEDVKQVLNKTMSPLVGIVILKQVCNHTIMCTGYDDMMKKKRKELVEKAEEDYGADSSDEEFIDNSEETPTPSMSFDMDDLDEKQQKALERRLKKIQEELIKERIRKEPIENLISYSIKAQMVKQLVEKCNEEGHRVLIFSQYTRMLDIIGLVLESMKVKYHRIDGSVSKHQERTRLVDDFNENKKIKCFILSSQAGGVGLNLVGASRVIIVDANFNPSIDEQSVDRCYRIGQKQNVIVYRLISAGTIEEYIYKRQVSKTTVSRTATIASNQYRYLSHADLDEMFSLKKTSHSETCAKMNRIHSKDRRNCDGLEDHIEYIKQMDGVVGISDHDVLFCNKADDVDSDEAEIEESNRLSRIELAKQLREAFQKASAKIEEMSEQAHEEQQETSTKIEESVSQKDL